MPNARMLVIALLTCLALVAAACGGEDEDAAAGPAETAGQTTEAQQPGDPQALADQISTDLEEKPSIPPGNGTPPDELVSIDIVEGEGRTAQEGDNVAVQYAGVNWSNGAEFDASWNTGQPFEFTLGAGNVITGWDEGVQGMKVGGRRMLVIPPDQAYGADGSPPAIGPDETLIFVIDLQDVQRGQ